MTDDNCKTPLARSGVNLFSSAEAFVSNNACVAVLSAYIKKPTLEKLNESGNINQVVVAWTIQDICSGASDFEELYEYCRDNNIELFRNTRIHLKVIWDYSTSAFLGSANISARGIESAFENFNWELSAIVNNLDLADQHYLRSRIFEGELITESRMNELRSHKESLNYQIPKPPAECKLSPRDIDYFQLSQLPRFRDVKSLYQCYSQEIDLSDEHKADLAHDLALYGVPLNLEERDLFNFLSESFNSHPFIFALCNWIKGIVDNRPGYSASAKFGQVTRWLVQNTTSKPAPYPRELDEPANVLYNWICYFNPDFERTGRPYDKGSDLLQYRPRTT